MKPPPVLTKAQNRVNFERGAYGNNLRTWRSPAEVHAAGYTGLLVSRYDVPGSPFCRYHIPSEQAQAVWNELLSRGAQPHLLYFNEQLQDQARFMRLQGEFYDGVLALGEPAPSLYYTLEKALMREALALGAQHVFGWPAELRVREAMTPSSYEDFLAVRDLYPDHVIEFTVLSKCWGTTPGRNAVVWECRRY